MCIFNEYQKLKPNRMKNYFLCFSVFFALLSCSQKEPQEKAVNGNPFTATLPSKKIELNDLSAFKKVTNNWQIVGNVFADKTQWRKIAGTEGTGILMNDPTDTAKKNLFTILEHEDIDIELDVMMPKGSNSGIYLQSRYEVQLFDSWGVEHPKYKDIGGIYQRWDKTKAKGKEGYEGHDPKINAAKAPGLWQHIKIKFSAPRFDSTGKKVKNAIFHEVWLNGVLLHENVSVTGPTRAAAFSNEVAKAPLMIQGDHGPVAFKNIVYKTYTPHKITFNNLICKEYNKIYKNQVPDLNMVQEIKAEEVDKVTLGMLKSRNYAKTIYYSGELNIPETGTYLFNFKTAIGGVSQLLINKKPVNSTKMYLEKGTAVPFELMASKGSPWMGTVVLNIEGPHLKLQSIDPNLATGKKPLRRNPKHTVHASEHPNTQRSFMYHNGEKRMHCISAGTPEGMHYSFDLDHASLLSVWSGDLFFDATQMWSSRGTEQFGRTGSFAVPMYGYREFAELNSENDEWNNSIEDIKFESYVLNTKGRPVYTHQMGATKLTNEMNPSNSTRGITRKITIEGPDELYHKINEGTSIKQLKTGGYIINNTSYYVEFPSDANLKPFIRKSKGKDELLVKIPSGTQTLEYTIIW